MTKNKRTTTFMILIAVLMWTVTLVAAEVSNAQPKVPSVPTAAVLTFESNLKEPDDSGKWISDILSARLGAFGDLNIVERQDIKKILDEQKLILSGLVSADKAVKVGKLLGAKLLITGRVTVTGTRVYVVCKVISAETSQVKGFFLSLPQNMSLDDLLDKTGEKLSSSLPSWIKQLIPKEKRAPDDVAVLKELLKDKKLPEIAVVIPEQHIGPQVRDPAVETEFKMLLTKAGLQPVKLSEGTSKEILSDLKKKNFTNVSRLLAKTRYLIYGEAFSERAGTLHGLTICSARAEVQIIDLESGKVIFADRQTSRAPDLSEYLAGKTALQKAGRRLAMKLLPKLIETFPEVQQTKNPIETKQKKTLDELK